MSTLIAIGYPDESTAGRAAELIESRARDLCIEPDAVAFIRRDKQGHCHVTTNYHGVGDGAAWGMFWGLLFGLLFFVPVFGMTVGAGVGALMTKVAETGIDSKFQDQVRDMLQQGTSLLFMVVRHTMPEQAVEAVGAYGGTVLRTSLSEVAEDELRRELSGATR